MSTVTTLTRDYVHAYRDTPRRRLSLIANHVACCIQERRFFPACDEVWTPDARARMRKARALVEDDHAPAPVLRCMLGVYEEVVCS